MSKSNFVLYEPANATLDDIWRYTVKQWDEAQAEKYINGLFETLEKASKHEMPWRTLHQQLQLEAFFVKYKRHYLFFRELEDGVLGVISIIHERRDIVSVLEEESQQIN